MGGKSRKGGGISKALIAQIKSNSGRKCSGSKKTTEGSNLNVFEQTEKTESDS